MFGAGCRRVAGWLAVMALLAGCGSPSPGTEGAHEHAPGSDPAAMLGGHVHGVQVNPGDGDVYFATHEGLYRRGARLERVGLVLDLMGFVVAGPNHFYASGHPGPGVDMPQPLGLIESLDGGRTWRQLSRQGQTDFHALAASAAGIFCWDGAALLHSRDGKAWTELQIPTAPHALAASSDGRTLLATAASGLMRSDDTGVTWSPLSQAPPLQLVDWVDGRRVVGVGPDGAVAVSDDSGDTWQQRGQVSGTPHAMNADLTQEGAVQVLVVTDAGISESADAGRTFRTLPTMKPIG